MIKCEIQSDSMMSKNRIVYVLNVFLDVYYGIAVLTDGIIINNMKIIF